jgi:hypothetical protein
VCWAVRAEEIGARIRIDVRANKTALRKPLVCFTKCP